MSTSRKKWCFSTSFAWHISFFQINVPFEIYSSNLQQRQLNGSLNRVPPDFYERVWKVVGKTPEGIVVANHHLPQQPTLSDMTEYELTFAFAVDDLLNAIAHPEYRQMMVEV